MEMLKTFGADLKYAFHVILHPLDGFWDLKHEKRGRAYISVLFIVMYVITSILNKQFNNYTFNEFKVFPEDIDILGTFVTTALAVIVWVAANWGLTTLFDGEGFDTMDEAVRLELIDSYTLGKDLILKYKVLK